MVTPITVLSKTQATAQIANKHKRLLDIVIESVENHLVAYDGRAIDVPLLNIPSTLTVAEHDALVSDLIAIYVGAGWTVVQETKNGNPFLKFS